METGTRANVCGWREWLSLYCEERRQSGSAAYADQHEHRVRFFMRHTGLTDYSDITPRHTNLWKNYLLEHGQPRPTDGYQNPNGCGASALKTHVHAMKAYWDWLVRIEAVVPRPNPFQGMRLPPKIHTDQRALTTAEILRLIEYAEADEYGPQRESEPDGTVRYRSSLYRVLSVSGYRINEARRLRWRDLELHRDPARIVLPAAKGKAAKGRVSLLPESVRESLLVLAKVSGSQPVVDKGVTGSIGGYRAIPDMDNGTQPGATGRNGGKRDPRLIRNGSASDPQPDPADLVWPWLSGRPNTVLGALRRDCKRCGVDLEDDRGRKVGWHAFRRAVASELARSGVNPKIAQRILGHSQVSTTLKHYTDIDDGQIFAAAKSLSGGQLSAGRSGDTGKNRERRSRGLHGDDDDVPCTRHGHNNHDENRDSLATQQAVTSKGRRDRMDAGGRATASATVGNERHRFESCIAHSNTDARLVRAALELLSAAGVDSLTAAEMLETVAEIVARSPEKGTKDERRSDDEHHNE